jgi:2-C-methyl-D-erythritol 4-phosphate cytidylyltransferase/2-C-methyl-D-erythritol 2,4-cyclodiphosphate synthase
LTDRWAAVVPAAGSSQRMGRNKLTADMGGAPVLVRTLELLVAAGLRQLVVGVPAAGGLAAALDQVRAGGAQVVAVPGGATRQETVRRCLAALPPAVEYVLVHDAARPYCSPSLVRRVQAAAERWGAAAAACPAVDTVHRAGADGAIRETLDRAQLWLAQTPQGFRRDLLVAAHASASDPPSATDDAGLCVALGQRVQLVEGERGNVKLTYPEDLPESGPPWAVGQGYDVHRLAASRPLILGGVLIPHDRGLVGHSDADVLCHALADAVLGGAGLGGIGAHFPPDDPAYAGADSVGLLQESVRRAEAAGWRPVQADGLLLAEEPRLQGYVPAMRARLAGALCLDPARVNVKVGSNEGLGWLGRGEGIAAQAVVLLQRLRGLEGKAAPFDTPGPPR